MTAPDTLAKLLAARAGAMVEIGVRRGPEAIALGAVPDAGIPAEASHLGMSVDAPVRLRRYGLGGAVVASLEEMRDLSTLLFEILGKLVGAKMSIRAISGPLEIAVLSGATAREGITPLLHFLGLVSLQLGIVNLLPIPVLDGGHIFILALEGIARRELSVKLKERLAQVGMGLLLLLMAVVIYFDIVKTFFS